MVEKFVGTWKMVSSENFDDYMKAIGRTRFGIKHICTYLISTLSTSSFRALGFLVL